MICVSLAEPSLAACLQALKGISLAEIRLDQMSLRIDEVRTLFSSHPQLVATCRPGPFDNEE